MYNLNIEYMKYIPFSLSLSLSLSFSLSLYRVLFSFSFIQSFVAGKVADNMRLRNAFAKYPRQITVDAETFDNPNESDVMTLGFQVTAGFLAKLFSKVFAKSLAEVLAIRYFDKYIII